jgi:peptidoglycan/xylan/chitin deacetylase (PgdA/CDA1 family)
METSNIQKQESAEAALSCNNIGTARIQGRSVASAIWFRCAEGSSGVRSQYRRCVSSVRKVVISLAGSWLGSVTHVDTRGPVVALTFDDGPHPTYTPQLLDLLKRNRALATFFMVGQAAARYPAIVRRIVEEGHAIGNHSWDHPSFPRISGRERRRQIRLCAKVLGRHDSGLFRPPYTDQSWASRFDAMWLRQKVIMFNCEVGDWFESSSDRIAEQLCKSVRPGSIVALHDALYDQGKPKIGPRLDREPLVDRGPMLRALEQFLAKRGSHFRFVTVPELLRCGRPHRVNWYQAGS